MSAGYNGWTNYETWNVNLWIDNDQGSQEYWKEQAETALTDAEYDKEKAAGNLADMLKEEHNDNMPEVSGVYADLLGAALQEVNWHEIAEHFLSDIEVWTAGFNMPGYMPDSEPASFATDTEARAYIAEEMRSYAETFDVPGPTQDVEVELRNAAETVEEGSGEYGQTIGQYHYWVTKN